MTRAKAFFIVAGVVILGFCALSIQAAQDDFSGAWVLDKEHARGLPKNMKDYTMVVSRDGQQLVVETQMESKPLSSETNTGVNIPQTAVQASNQNNSQGMLRSSGSGGDIKPSNGSMAITSVIPHVTYSLDGKKTTAHVSGLGEVELKAKLGKDGKSLELSFSHQEFTNGQNVTLVSSKERWTLAEGGQVLRVQRTASTPDGSDTVNLIFRKKQPAK